MADSLRRLVKLASFTALQEKLDQWLDCYHTNSCDQNVSRCCELIELNSRIQSQLFNLLSLTSSEGGLYGGANIIRTRLLPWLSHGFQTAAGLLGSKDVTSLGLPSTLSKVQLERDLERIKDSYERSLRDLESDLKMTQTEANQLHLQLEEARDELDDVKRRTTNEKFFTEIEVQEIRSKLRLLENELSTLKLRGHSSDNCEYQIRRLKEDLAWRTGERYLKGISSAVGSRDVSPKRSVNWSGLSRPSSPFAIDDVTQKIHQDNLVARFNEMYSRDRQAAMDALMRYSDNRDLCQKITFAVMQEAFTAAKLAFTNYKMKVRSSLVMNHSGSLTLEEAVQDYINRNPDSYDLPYLISEVTRALNRRLDLQLPADASFTVIHPFIREACKLAWGFQSLAHPMDIAVAANNELFDDNKYRRYYNSDYGVPLVDHHVWPCLMQGLRVIVKGEAYTKRSGGAGRTHTASSVSRSRSLTRSPTRSPTRSITPVRTRSRSPSPVKRPIYTNPYLYSSYYPYTYYPYTYLPWYGSGYYSRPGSRLSLYD